MILSVSRRTDIPNYYSPWFFNRIREGYLYVRNPINAHQISKINLSPEVVDGIVFWTKNPAGMLGGLETLAGYAYCFHFTITGYGRDVEPLLPDKRTELMESFRWLSGKIGRDSMVWRYDPIFFNERYTPEYHLKAFAEIARGLAGYTGKATISLLDFYKKTVRNTKDMHITNLTQEELAEFALKMLRIAQNHELSLVTCAAQNRLTSVGIKGEGCIEKAWMERITGCRLKGGLDKNQRGGCGCIESIDVGTYDTCINGCRYCYANDNGEKVKKLVARYQADSPLLCGNLEQGDVITERKVKSLKEMQISLF